MPREAKVRVEWSATCEPYKGIRMRRVGRQHCLLASEAEGFLAHLDKMAPVCDDFGSELAHFYFYSWLKWTELQRILSGTAIYYF